VTPSDLVRLRHMLDAAEAAIADLRGRSREDLDSAPWLPRSVVQCLQVIGEAAARIDRKTQESLPEIPWADMVAMRNRLVHAYWDVDLDVVWRTVAEDLPGLVSALDPLLREGPD